LWVERKVLDLNITYFELW